MRSARRAANSSATAAWTKKRLAAVQASPMLRIFAWKAASTATVEVGVLEHQERGVATELHRGAQDAVGGLRQQELADRGGAGEGQLADDAAVEHQRDDLGRPAGGQDAEHPVRQAGVGEDLRERQRARAGSAAPASGC